MEELLQDATDDNDKTKGNACALYRGPRASCLNGPSLKGLDDTVSLLKMDTEGAVCAPRYRCMSGGVICHSLQAEPGLAERAIVREAAKHYQRALNSSQERKDWSKKSFSSVDEEELTSNEFSFTGKNCKDRVVVTREPRRYPVRIKSEADLSRATSLIKDNLANIVENYLVKQSESPDIQYQFPKVQTENPTLKLPCPFSPSHQQIFLNGRMTDIQVPRHDQIVPIKELSNTVPIVITEIKTPTQEENVDSNHLSKVEKKKSLIENKTQDESVYAISKIDCNDSLPKQVQNISNPIMAQKILPRVPSDSEDPLVVRENKYKAKIIDANLAGVHGIKPKSVSKPVAKTVKKLVKSDELGLPTMKREGRIDIPVGFSMEIDPSNLSKAIGSVRHTGMGESKKKEGVCPNICKVSPEVSKKSSTMHELVCNKSTKKDAHQEPEHKSENIESKAFDFITKVDEVFDNIRAEEGVCGEDLISVTLKDMSVNVTPLGNECFEKSVRHEPEVSTDVHESKDVSTTKETEATVEKEDNLTLEAISDDTNEIGMSQELAESNVNGGDKKLREHQLQQTWSGISIILEEKVTEAGTEIAKVQDITFDDDFNGGDRLESEQESKEETEKGIQRPKCLKDTHKLNTKSSTCSESSFESLPYRMLSSQPDSFTDDVVIELTRAPLDNERLRMAKQELIRLERMNAISMASSYLTDSKDEGSPEEKSPGAFSESDLPLRDSDMLDLPGLRNSMQEDDANQDMCNSSLFDSGVEGMLSEQNSSGRSSVIKVLPSPVESTTESGFSSLKEPLPNDGLSHDCDKIGKHDGLCLSKSKDSLDLTDTDRFPGTDTLSDDMETLSSNTGDLTLVESGSASKEGSSRGSMSDSATHENGTLKAYFKEQKSIASDDSDPFGIYNDNPVAFGHVSSDIQSEEGSVSTNLEGLSDYQNQESYQQEILTKIPDDIEELQISSYASGEDKSKYSSDDSSVSKMKTSESLSSEDTVVSRMSLEESSGKLVRQSSLEDQYEALENQLQMASIEEIDRCLNEVTNGKMEAESLCDLKINNTQAEKSLVDVLPTLDPSVRNDLLPTLEPCDKNVPLPTLDPCDKKDSLPTQGIGNESDLQLSSTEDQNMKDAESLVSSGIKKFEPKCDEESGTEDIATVETHKSPRFSALSKEGRQSSVADLIQMYDSKSSESNESEIFDSNASICNDSEIHDSKASIFNMSEIRDSQSSVCNISEIRDSQSSICNVSEIYDSKANVFRESEIPGGNSSIRNDTLSSMSSKSDLGISVVESDNPFKCDVQEPSPSTDQVPPLASSDSPQKNENPIPLTNGTAKRKSDAGPRSDVSDISSPNNRETCSTSDRPSRHSSKSGVSDLEDEVFLPPKENYIFDGRPVIYCPKIDMENQAQAEAPKMAMSVFTVVPSKELGSIRSKDWKDLGAMGMLPTGLLPTTMKDPSNEQNKDSNVISQASVEGSESKIDVVKENSTVFDKKNNVSHSQESISVSRETLVEIEGSRESSTPKEKLSTETFRNSQDSVKFVEKSEIDCKEAQALKSVEKKEIDGKEAQAVKSVVDNEADAYVSELGKEAISFVKRDQGDSITLENSKYKNTDKDSEKTPVVKPFVKDVTFDRTKPLLTSSSNEAKVTRAVITKTPSSEKQRNSFYGNIDGIPVVTESKEPILSPNLKPGFNSKLTYDPFTGEVIDSSVPDTRDESDGRKRNDSEKSSLDKTLQNQMQSEKISCNRLSEECLDAENNTENLVDKQMNLHQIARNENFEIVKHSVSEKVSLEDRSDKPSVFGLSHGRNVSKSIDSDNLGVEVMNRKQEESERKEMSPKSLRTVEKSLEKSMETSELNKLEKRDSSNVSLEKVETKLINNADNQVKGSPILSPVSELKKLKFSKPSPTVEDLASIDSNLDQNYVRKSSDRRKKSSDTIAEVIGSETRNVRRKSETNQRRSSFTNEKSSIPYRRIDENIDKQSHSNSPVNKSRVPSIVESVDGSDNSVTKVLHKIKSKTSEESESDKVVNQSSLESCDSTISIKSETQPSIGLLETDIDNLKDAGWCVGGSLEFLEKHSREPVRRSRNQGSITSAKSEDLSLKGDKASLKSQGSLDKFTHFDNVSAQQKARGARKKILSVDIDSNKIEGKKEMHRSATLPVGTLVSTKKEKDEKKKDKEDKSKKKKKDKEGSGGSSEKKSTIQSLKGLLKRSKGKEKEKEKDSSQEKISSPSLFRKFERKSRSTTQSPSLEERKPGDKGLREIATSNPNLHRSGSPFVRGMPHSSSFTSSPYRRPHSSAASFSPAKRGLSTSAGGPLPPVDSTPGSQLMRVEEEGPCRKNLDHETDKPPNVLVYAANMTDYFVAIRETLRRCLNQDRYTIYQLTDEMAFKSPWPGSTTLLVVCGDVPAHISTAFIRYLLQGGRVLSICSDFLNMAVPLFGTVEVQEQAIVSVSYQQWSGVQLLHHQHCFHSSPQHKRFSKDVEPPKPILNRSAVSVEPTHVEITDEWGGRHRLNLTILATDDTWGAPSLLSARLHGSKGKAVFSQVHLERDPRECFGASEVSTKLSSSNEARLEILKDLLLTELGMDTTLTNSLTTYTPAYFLGRHELKQELLAKLKPHMEGQELRRPHVTMQFVTFGECAKKADEDFLPIYMNACPMTFSTVKYYEALKTKYIGRLLIYSDIMTSSMKITAGHPPLINGLAVIPSQQTDGKGRSGNTWLSPLGSAMFTIQLQVNLTSTLGQYLSFIQHLIAIAVADAVRDQPGYEDIPVNLKWPNDIYIGSESKIGGVIVEATTIGNVIIANIGVGVNLSNSNPTYCINDSIRQYNKDHGVNLPELERETFFARTFNAFEELLDTFQTEGPEAVLPKYYKYWLHSNSTVIVQNENFKSESAVITGVDSYGFLEAQLVSGASITLHPDGNSFNMMDGLIYSKYHR